MRSKAVFLLTFLAFCVWGQELPPRLSDADYIDAQAELERLGPIDGVWVGTLRPILDPVGGYRV